MSEDNMPYIEQQPGDLITAEAWNELQCLIKGDILDTTQKAIDEITKVPEAGDSEKLEGKTLAELTQEIVDRAVAEVRTRRGYKKLFVRLTVGKTKEIEHGFNACPLVDAYQLDYFPVLCGDDKEPSWTNFYAFHSGSEVKLRYTADDKRGTLEIQPRRGPVWQVPLQEMLQRLHVEYDDNWALSDGLNELWQALDPDGEFDACQYCHSPWFEKCCRAEMCVRDVKKKGHWDDLCVQWRARKTINYPGIDTRLLETAPSPAPGTPPRPTVFGTLDAESAAEAGVVAPFTGFVERRAFRPSPNRGDDECPTPAPTQIQVDHFDFNTLGVTLLKPPVHPAHYFQADALPPGLPPLDEQVDDVANELKLMLLLKC